MNSNLRFSIITPSFNQGKFIRDTIESVLMQNYQNFEHIVIDGGSTDNTINILREYPHLKWVSEKDSGQANAINKGFKMATGNIFSWLNSDDYYEKDIFKIIAKYFEENKSCNFLYGDITYVDEDKQKLSMISGNELNFKKLLINPDLVRQPSSFWRKEILNTIGFLDESLNIVMDYDYILKISNQYKLCHLKSNLSYFRTYSKSKTTKNYKEQAIEIKKVWKKFQSSISLRQNIFFGIRYFNINKSIIYKILDKIIHLIKK
ncbi:MAG: glycosyltransferase family 2 protein [Bacteroidetes bacterium]|nr:glycosyltransferase family 2 protein [Bacteroidota bacterium]